MIYSKAIGGYFELDGGSGVTLHDDAIQLGSGRNCFEYVLKANNARKVYMPEYTCDVLFEPLKKLGIPLVLYAVNDSLEIKEEISLSEGEFLLYTNYFGIKDMYCRQLAGLYGSGLILDYSQAYYADPPKGSHTFYSPRKFFGLPDGGQLYTMTHLSETLPTATSFEHISHLVKRIDLGPEAGYEDFKRNDSALSDQPLRLMSALTRKLMGTIDHDFAVRRRKENFSYVHERLGGFNGLTMDTESITAPFCYPFISGNSELRQKLIDASIYIPIYWPNVLNGAQKQSLEYYFAHNILPLPIDQRYTVHEDMERMCGLILQDQSK